MKSLEFIYWLQGYCEVCDFEDIDSNKTQIIKNHLEMVKITEGRNKLPFCHWLEGLLDGNTNDYLNKKQTTTIKNKLNSIFDHVVERKIQNSNKINQGFQDNLGEPSFLIKC